jgi:hypothetical protein
MLWMAGGGWGTGRLIGTPLESTFEKGVDTLVRFIYFLFLIIMLSIFSHMLLSYRDNFSSKFTIRSSILEFCQNIQLIGRPHLGRSQPHLPSSTAPITMRIYAQFVASTSILQNPAHPLIRLPVLRMQKTCSWDLMHDILRVIVLENDQLYIPKLGQIPCTFLKQHGEFEYFL